MTNQHMGGGGGLSSPTTGSNGYAVRSARIAPSQPYHHTTSAAPVGVGVNDISPRMVTLAR
jgi:hypothetical protein